MISTKLLIVLGLPGTGKSTFARALATSLDARHLNSDVIRDAMGQRTHYDAAAKATVYQELLKQTETVLQNGQSVVVDATFYQKEWRQKYRQLGKRLDLPVLWIEIRADESVVRERVSQKRLYSEADFAVYQKIKAQYEPLEGDHLVLWSDQLPVKMMVEKAKAYISTYSNS